LNLPVLAALHRSATLSLPSRHLGLVQAQERIDLDAFLNSAASALAHSLDLDGLMSLAEPPAKPTGASARFVPPAQVIAVARDEAFAFCYPHLLDDWRAQGAELTFFSPLADDAVPQAGFIYLPGGYPELHAARLSNSQNFIQSMRKASETTVIYGECGGYMVLGEALIDASGTAHDMLNLLPLVTSFEHRKLHLGYRSLHARNGPFKGRFAAHEFHYASTLKATGADPLFSARNAEGDALPDMGLVQGHVAGSFAHLVDVTVKG
jgi:cobyrinic acid a,c-diamide synthase